jgi:arsenite-transporting ATPase
MRLPFVSRDDMDVHRRGDELFVRVGTYKRSLILPATLQRLEVRGASFVGDRLEISFAREPEAGSTQSGGT